MESFLPSGCPRTVACFLLAAVVLPRVAGAAEGEDHSSNRKPNHLIDATSPYLLQHAYNPVDWYEWGEEAFERARKENKPIFLSIGYAACHWCHVMAHESFENEEIAAILNEHFISIKVDREERPDIDEVYMAATVAMTGRGGWPMSVFMTPQREPFECGTYFPPEDGRGRRGFRGLITEIAQRWEMDPRSLVAEAGSLASKVKSRKTARSGVEIIARSIVTRNAERLASRFDTALGGYRTGGNKFPPTMVMELLMREYATRKVSSKPQLLAGVEATLHRMAEGGIYDHIGGGICRYSTDPRWFAPHFEKMLYDQARVAGVYLSAYQLTHDETYGRTARGILDFCIREMQSPEGGFYSSFNADSEGEEGKFYVWTRKEIEDVLKKEDAALFIEYYNVSSRGNWHRGRNILHVNANPQEFPALHGLTDREWSRRLNHMREVLYDVRSGRVPPSLDDKILAEWNGLLITTMARAYRILDEPRYRDAAVAAADFILTNMVVDGRLQRVHRRGKTYNPGYSVDYANMIEALITLFETTSQRKWLAAAVRLNDALVEHFSDDSKGGFFYTAHDAEKLLFRSKQVRDGVVPSGNSTEVLNLLRLAVLLNRPELRGLAEKTMRAMQPVVRGGGLPRLQWGVLFYHDKPKEIAIVGDPRDPATEALIREVYRNYLPNKVVAMGAPSDAAAPNALPLLKRKTLVKGRPAAYVCRNYVCGRPVTSPADLAKQLAGKVEP